jgi:methionyl-tRNA formyltransferase
MPKICEKKLKICFIGGKQAGILGLLTLLAAGNKILSAVSYSKDLTKILNTLNIPSYNSVYDGNFIKKLKQSSILISVHAREIIGPKLLKLPKLCCINIHPYLYKYKGANPVSRALKDKEFEASVGAHIMGEKVDHGEVIVEEFVDVTGSKSTEEVYNKLYPFYIIVILKALEIITQNGL